MRQYAFGAASICLLLVVARGASGQQPLSGADAGSILYVLQSPAAQADLKLSKQQRNAVRLLVGQYETVVRPVANRHGRERVAARKAATTSARETEAKVRIILSPSQLERVEQILFQYPQGPRYLLQPNLAFRLHLTDQQVAMVNQLTMQSQASLAHLDLSGIDPGQIGAARYEMVRTLESQAADLVLSDQQAAALVDALGTPFDWGSQLVR